MEGQDERKGLMVGETQTKGVRVIRGKEACFEQMTGNRQEEESS